ncbi:MAG TPA: ATP-binding protein [Steroidobacteraceae bacterium]|nr:ATP-binding protein [Steroidobacteraceae bacterium]
MTSACSAPKRVVYVDDDDDIRQIASLALALNPDITVDTFESGEAALAMLPRLMPEFILLDVMMPGLDGPSTLARIRANPLFAHVPIAFMTAKAMPNEVERFIELGAVGVIPKPFDPMQLAAQVSELWRRSAAANVPALPLPAARPGSGPSSDELALAARASRLEWLLKGVLEVQTLINEANFDLDTFMQRVVDSAQQLTDAMGAVVELVDGDEMRYQCVSESLRQHIGLRLRRAGSLSGLCVEEARVLTCDDSETDPRVDQAACRRVGVRSMCCTPLFQTGRAVGVLKVMSREPRGFDADDNYLLTLLGGALGAALGKQLALEALRTSEETFRSAMENASIGMALCTPAGGFMKVNTALCELLGYAEADLLATDFQSLTHPADLDADVRLMNQVLAGEIRDYRLEKRYFHKSGRTVWALLSVSLVRHRDGAPNYFVAQMQDVSEQREIERVKGEFISTVSHELRTPLTSIRGSIGLILGTMAGALPKNAKNLLDIAQNNSERLILLINDILDIDKIASGNMRFDMQEKSLAEITSAAVTANITYAQKFGAKIRLLPVDERARLLIDADRYTQVLTNLISNAAKFSPAGAEILVRTETLGNRLRVSVSDQGAGIPVEFRAHVFEKFSQGDSSAARRAGGTGLGLHITRELVEHMGGRIGFDTETNRGTTFWIEFGAR